MDARGYNLILLGTALVAAIIGTGFALWLEPFDGDLTRTGYFSENAFGWRGPQPELPRQMIHLGPGEPSDVLIAGDSFSLSHAYAGVRYTNTSWADIFARDTGLNVRVIGNTELEGVLKGPAFRRHPPPVLVYERVERKLIHGNELPYRDCPMDAHALVSGRLLKRAPVALLQVTTQRPERPDLADLQLTYGLDFGWKNLLRAVHPVGSLADAVAVDRHDLFSSTDTNSMLVYSGDVEKSRWTGQDWKNFDCNFRGLQRRVEANGHTHFVLLIVPDKLTAYAPYVRDPALSRISRLDEILGDPQLHIVRADAALSEAIRAGRKDVYLPNNTHWGWEGKIAVEKVVLGYFKAHGFFDGPGMPHA